MSIACKAPTGHQRPWRAHVAPSHGRSLRHQRPWGLFTAQSTHRSLRAPLPVRCAAEAADADVIVVGGGVGGLATAGRLAKAGLRVTVLEKNSTVGGRAASITLGGCRFDTGPSLLLFPDKYKEAFEGLGSRLEDHVDIRRVGPAAYRVWFGDNTHLDLLNDPDAMAAQLEGVEVGAGEGFRRFIQMARTSLEMGVPYFIDRDFTKLEDAKGLADLLPILPRVNVLDLLGQHDGRLKRFFRDQRLRAMFTFQDLYVGLSPYSAPAVFSLLAGTELTDGVWYPRGGFGKVVEGLASAAQACGAAIRTESEVAQILTDPGTGAVTGVRLSSGETLQAKVVLCNRDLPAAYELLMGQDGPGPDDDSGSDSDSTGPSASSSTADSSRGGGGSWWGSLGGATRQQAGRGAGGSVADYAMERHAELGRLKYSNGVISFNWCVSRRLDRLLHHNVFLSDEWRASWEPAATPAQLRRRPNFYVHVPARTDPSAAPEGCDSVMVLLPVACMQQVQGGYEELVAAGRERILASFRESGVGDIESAITQELVITPPGWSERYGLRHGAAFGLAHGIDQLSVFRPGTKDRRVNGLYFVGASSRPGNGVPLCLIGAKLAAERVLEDWRGGAAGAAAQ